MSKEKVLNVIDHGIYAVGFMGITIVIGCGGYHVMLYLLTSLGV